TIPRTEQMKHHHTYTAIDYNEELNKLANDKEYFNKQTRIIQLPYIEKSETNQIKKEERKKQQGERLKKLAQKRKNEKKQQLEQELQYLQNIQEIKDLEEKLK